MRRSSKKLRTLWTLASTAHGFESIEPEGDEAKLEVYGSPYLQLAAGINYTGDEGFVFTATTGYAFLLRKNNTRFAEGSRETYDKYEPLYDGGVILSVAFGYAF